MGEEKVLYSVKMRSSLGGAHGVGGQHISGAERIVTKNSVEQEMISMLHRAWEHDRGAADFIQFKVEALRHEGITCCPLCRQRSISETGGLPDSTIVAVER